MSKILLFFGAGASFGAYPRLSSISRAKPPLGKDLFARLREKNPTLWKLVEHCFVPNKHFEDGWKELAHFYEHNYMEIHKHHRDLAQLFFQYKIDSNNLYWQLVKKIDFSKWSGSFATLNYDLLLQRALLSKSFTQEQVYTMVCMPHGCCAVISEFGNVKAANLQVGAGGKIIASCHVEYLDQNKHGTLLAENGVPMMAYYNEMKHVVINSDKIEEQKDNFAKLAQESEKIIIVGVYPALQDKHIWEALAQTQAEIFYFNPGKEDSLKFQEWSDSVQAKSKTFQQDFQHGFRDICNLAEIDG